MPAADRELDRSALSSVAWMGAAKWSSQIFSWVATILVARILMPDDFGLVATGAVFINVVTILSEFGIGVAIITFRELSPLAVRQLNTFSVSLGLGGTILTLLAAHPLARFFRSPDLPPVVMLLGLSFVISSLHTVPSALLRREMQFRTIAGIDVVRGLVMPVITLTGALLGLRYWALVLGTILGTSLGTLLTLARRRVGFARPTIRDLRAVFRFSGQLLVSRVAWTVYQNADFAVAGRALPLSAVGDYNMAVTLATSPLDKVTAVLGDVVPPLFAAVQDDRPALRRYFLNLSEILCFGMFPVAIGISLVSHDLVDLVLGDKWVGVSMPLALLAVYAGVRGVTSLYAHLFNATRETRFGMYASIAAAVLLLTGFIIGSRWGATGIAAAWLVIHPAFLLFVFGKVGRILALPLGEYLRALRLGVDGSITMVLCVVAFQRLVAADWPIGARFAASVACGVAGFVIPTLVLHHRRLREIRDWLQRIRRGAASDLTTGAT